MHTQTKAQSQKMPHTNDVPDSEREVFDSLTEIRSKLSALKKDRSQYLNSKDVQTVYGKVMSHVHELHKIRKANHTENEIANRVDQVLDDVFQLLSLFFLAVGLTKAAPATYASLITVQRLLEHLSESKVYTHHDLTPIKQRLDEIEQIIQESSVEEEEHSLLKNKLQECLDEYKTVEHKIDGVSPQLQSLLEKLVSLRRRLLGVASRPDSFDPKELEPLEAELQELRTHRDSEGKFQSLETGQVVVGGQRVLNGLLDDCTIMINDLHAHNFKLDKTLEPIYERLLTLKTTLEDLLVTRRWTLRETDLYTYQKQLQEIDDTRVNGKFPTSSEDSSKGQFVLLYLLRRCYAFVYKLLESSEPVSEALQPIHNQLSTVRRCLLEVKRMGGINSARELYPYQMKLASLDNLREDGKFVVDGQVPEGQGTLTALLAECYDICEEMKIEAEDREEEEGEQHDEDDDEGLYEHDDDEEDDDDDDDQQDDIYDELEPEDYNVPSYAPSIADSELKN